jgi:hypothetical protein
MNVSQLLYGAGVVAGDQIKKHKDDFREEAIKGYHQISTIGAYFGTGLVATGLSNRFQEGLLYSFGAEPVVADKGFGFVRADKGKKGLLNGIVSGSDGFYTPGKGLYSNISAGSKSAMESNVRSVFATKAGGVVTQNALSTILPAGFTLYFAADAYANDGAVGLGKYMVADTIGNYYGTQAALNTFKVTDAAKATKFTKAVEPLARRDLLQRIAPIAGSGMVGRMLPVLGGIMGATVGMEVGATLGSAATSLMNTGGPSDSSGQLLGGLLGTVAGAKLGSAMMSGIPTAIVGGLAIAATTSIVSRNMDALKSGFNTQRGLNFAGETAEYFTQNAVTMRERAVQSMHKSNMNARSAFGQEASLMHMNRDMFSQYKRPLR